MRKSYLFGLVVVLVMLLLGSSSFIPSVAQSAATASPGCQNLNSPSFDAHYGGGVVGGYDFWAGEIILMSVENGTNGATTAQLCVDSECTSTPLPGLLSYTFSENVTVGNLIWSLNAGFADWAVSCLAPGCDTYVSLTPNAVVGRFTADAPTYWAPGKLVVPLTTISAGKTAWVLGMDASGGYYKIVWACDTLWVPANTVGPNVDDPVWQGAPLPTDVVE